MIKVKYMLFDLDGTLIDSKADLARSINLMLADLGRPPLKEATVASFVGDGVRVLVYRSLTATDSEGLPPDENLHATAIALMRKHYADQMLVKTKLYHHVPETLEYFKDKRKAIVTSKEVRFAEVILERLGIAKYFDCIVGGDTLLQRKPDPAPVLEALRRLKGMASEAVMVGDSENDISAGRGAGTMTCAVTYGFRTSKQLSIASPDFIIDSFDKLKDFFC
jgi:phosphoglycolate phosphatase